MGGEWFHFIMLIRHVSKFFLMDLPITFCNTICFIGIFYFTYKNAHPITVKCFIVFVNHS